MENAIFEGSLQLCLTGGQQGAAMHPGLGTCLILLF